MFVHVNAKGRQLEYVCTIGMGNDLAAERYVVMHMVMNEHEYNILMDWQYFVTSCEI
jgi:hypothetical protein